MRAVIDTNILISGFISSKSYPAKVVDLWVTGNFEPVVSKEIIAEYSVVLIRDKFSVLGSVEQRLDLLTRLLSLPNVVLVTPQQKVNIVKNDPKDNIFLECALEGRCKYIVSGDQHLREIKEYREIKILEPCEFVDYGMDYNSK
jgi:putative PIN family toxin of toxin-antitoxin system